VSGELTEKERGSLLHNSIAFNATVFFSKASGLLFFVLKKLLWPMQSVSLSLSKSFSITGQSLCVCKKYLLLCLFCFDLCCGPYPIDFVSVSYAKKFVENEQGQVGEWWGE
jgi:hypothetical protein